MSETTFPRKVTRRERWSWYYYDFGNSAYAAVVLLAVYSAYFKGVVVGGAEGTRLWGIAIGITMLFVAIISPILGTIADFSGSKKKLLIFFTMQCILFCGLLFFVRAGDVVMGMVFFILAEIGYRAAQVFYDALLPDIAYPEEMGRVSGNGWAIGSFGGILCLLIVLALIMLIGGDFITRLSLVITSVFYLASSLPLFFWLKEENEPHKLPKGENYIGLAFKRLGATFREVKTFKEFIKFSIAFLVYNDGILMVMDFAAILGAILFGLDQTQLIVFMIIVQVTSVLGAYLFGLVTTDYSGKIALNISLTLMIGCVIWLYFAQSVMVFYIIGGVAGFALTGVQSVSRTLVGVMAPEGKSAEFYGFFSVAGRTSSFIGPTIFGFVVAAATNNFIAQNYPHLLAEQMGHRLALFSIIAFLVVGMIILQTVKLPRVRAHDPAPRA